MKKIKYFIAGSAFCLGAAQIPGIQTLAHAESFSAKMANAGFNTVLGMGTVFLMLIVMAFIIYAFRIIPVLQKKFAKKEESQPVATEKVQAVKVSEPQEPLMDDLELVAVIAAAIAASEEIPIDSFRVRTIKRRR